MELGPQNHNGDGLLEPNSIIVVYMNPLGYEQVWRLLNDLGFVRALGFGVQGLWLGASLVVWGLRV